MSRTHLSLAQIEAFCALAQYKSFKDAAQYLDIAQPTLVNRIASIEESYNAKLFLRQRGNNRLTDLGLALLPRFRSCLNSLREAEFLLLAHSKVETGEIHIAAVSPYRVSLLIKHFNSLYPNIRVKVSFAASELVGQMITRGEVDAGFYVPEGNTPGQQAFFFYEYELIAILPADHPLAQRERLHLRDFENQSVIRREPGSLTRQLFEQAVAREGVSVNVVYELGSRESIREAVAQGLGISVVADDEHVPHDNIVTRRIVGEGLTARSSLVVRNDRVSAPLTQALIGVVRQPLES